MQLIWQFQWVSYIFLWVLRGWTKIFLDLGIIISTLAFPFCKNEAGPVIPLHSWTSLHLLVLFGQSEDQWKLQIFMPTSHNKFQSFGVKKNLRPFTLNIRNKLSKVEKFKWLQFSSRYINLKWFCHFVWVFYFSDLIKKPTIISFGSFFPFRSKKLNFSSEKRHLKLTQINFHKTE